MTVYLFWIVASILFEKEPDEKLEVVSFPIEFIDEIREALIEQYKLMYFKYLVRLKQSYMDAIIEVVPFFFTETVLHALKVKLKGHELPLGHSKTIFLICSVIF